MLPLDTLLHNRYLVEAQLGGDASPLYQALDLTTRAHVALQPLAEPAPGAAAEQAAALLALHHPHLPLARDLIAAQGLRVLVLDPVPADDLATLVQRHGRAPIELARRWVRQLFDALDYIHTLAPPLAHGAIEPSHIRLDPSGAAVLLGFGLGQLGDPTPFTPPEPQPGPAGDIYALAATLYYALVGEPPALAAERAAALAQGLPDPLVAPRALDTRVPAALSNAIRRALALDPAARPSAAELLLAIDELPQPVALSAQPRQLPWRRILPAAGALLALLALVFAFMRPNAAPPAASQPATSLPASLVAPEPTAAPALAQPPAATNLPAPTQVATAQPTAAPALSVSSVQPAELLTRTQPLTLTLQGANLALVKSARLVGADLPGLAATITRSSASELTLEVAAPASLPNGEAAYRIELNGALVETPPVRLRDFIERASVQGVLEQYIYTERVAADATGAFTRMRTEAGAASSPVGLLRNGDELDILEVQAGGWYLARIRASADPAQVGVVGWIEQWLVDNQGVPDAPTAWRFVGRLASAPTDAAVQCGVAFESSIYGSVEDASGVGIRGARLRIVSADQRNSYTVATGRGGVYNVPGLGCTRWSVRLLSVPGAPNGIQANVVAVRNLNGGKYTAAEVRYRLVP